MIGKTIHFNRELNCTFEFHSIIIDNPKEPLFSTIINISSTKKFGIRNYKDHKIILPGSLIKSQFFISLGSPVEK